jgi:hypothetical protein
MRWLRWAMLADLEFSTWGRPLLAAALFIAAQLIAAESRAAAPTTSPQWVDVTANGADPTGAADSTAAINTSIGLALTGGQPLYLPHGTYKVSSLIKIDYAGVANAGFRLISDGATIDGRGIATGAVLQVICSGGTVAAPANCFYFKEQGTLFVLASTPAYAFILGRADFSDAHNSAKLDHLVVNNTSTAAAAGACQFNFVLDSDIFAVCNSAGGAAGIALEQTQFSWIEGAGTASGPGGRSIVLENGFDFSNTLKALDLEVSPICLSITSPNNGLNTFLSPFLNCQTAISATASTGNTLINPNYGGAVVNFGPNSTGIAVLGPGSRNNWLFPNGAGYTAAPVDDGLSVSSFNAAGASLAVTLPQIAAVNAGWSMGFASDNGKGMTIAVPDSAKLLSGGLALATVTLGPGNYEYLRVQSDGNNWRITAASRATQLVNGFAAPPWPSRWLYPSSSGYAATAGDNGSTLSSYNAAGGLTVTLPSTTGLPNGWSMGFATDNGHGLSVQTNAVSGGHLLYPGSGALVTSIALAQGFPGQIAYEFVVVQYDNNGAGSNFRILSATPATAAALNMLGSSGISRWSFPSGSTAYLATAADNGNMVSSFNSPSSFMAVTLPSTTAINQGWTIGIASDNGKTMSAQVNAVSGGSILMPGSLGAVSSFSLWNQAYESAVLEFDGANFRVMAMTPISMANLGGTMPIGTVTSSSSACQTGAIQADATYLYFCTASHAWKRAAWSSF